jgi:hypothetical protein
MAFEGDHRTMLAGQCPPVDEGVDEPVEKQSLRGITVSFLWTTCGQPENHENTGRKLLCRVADTA